MYYNIYSDFRDVETFPDIDVKFSTEAPYSNHTPDVYIPFFTLIEFVSYMGWIKVRYHSLLLERI